MRGGREMEEGRGKEEGEEGSPKVIIMCIGLNS